MILENSLENFGYARVLLADYHLEYPLLTTGQARVQLAWDPNAISSIADSDYDKVEKVAEQLFPDLPARYSHHYEHGMSLWIIQGNVGAIAAVASDLAQSLMGGSSGDDDTFDYWPNAFEMLCELVGDILRLEGSEYYIGLVDRVVKSAIAINGPPDEWEAEEILTAVSNLTALYATTKEA